MTRGAVSLLVALALVGRAPAQPKYTETPLKPADREHWAFVPPKRPPVPKGGANPVDAFVRARLAKDGLAPAPPADKLTLIRRVTLDLTGLPPTSAEVDAFLKDDAPNAYEKVVERLLASPHFGERWATHWLDVVRFAESNGFEGDADRPHAWRYRDYVVKSFNDDKPYDRFVREQIAGDELAGAGAKEKPDLLIATGVHRCGPVHVVSGNLDAEVLRQEVMTEMVNGVGAAFLGLTFACTRCHDHKFDPLSAGDYYRLQAFFAGTKYADVDFATQAERDARAKLVADITAKTLPLKKRIADIDAPARAKVSAAKRAALEPKYREALDTPADKRTAEQRTLAAHANTLVKVSWDEVLAALAPADRDARAALREQLHALEAKLPPPPAAAWAIQKTGPVAKTFVLLRGETKQKALEVAPGFPRVLSAPGAPAPKSRADLANWLTRPDHPLTARVIVNRLWQHHFGRGLVATPNDFGTRGARPTHPELLDWLACELVARDWSLKHLHRLMVTSETYRQSARGDHGARADPGNALLWKMSRKRLEAEAVRDSILAAAGTLNRAVGGPSVKVPLEPEVYDLIFTEGEPDGLWPVTPDAAQHTRRSVYLFNKRNVRLPLLEALDQPDALNACAARPVSTFAPQALILMNSPFVHAQARALAINLAKETADPAKQLDALYRRAVGRAPTADERAVAHDFLTEQAADVRARLKAKQPIGIDAKELPAGADLAHVRALADLCAVLFNTHEFVYRP
ncbi:MAG: DUF1553 domain-containing protein [Planctomycetes bacterium]|nr:DUF1553 domain-containing protein [Planctomycetota bacterium]